MQRDSSEGSSNPGARPHPGSTAYTRRRFLGCAGALGIGTLLGAGLPGIPAVAAQSGAGKKRGGTLTMGIPGDIASFDPYQMFFGNFLVIQNVYDTLISYDENFRPHPRLANSWTVAPDGRSVTILLRKGVKFHSGKDLLAEDVVKNFEKAADKDRGFSLNPLVMNLQRATAPDPGTVILTFKGPTADITDILQTLPIVDPTAMDSLKSRGSGTGPFRFLEWIPGDHATLDRNPAYWNGPAPYVDRVVVKSFRDTDAMVAALQSGLLDLAMAVPLKDVARLSSGFTVLRGAPAVTYDMRINVKRPPFDRKEARQALWYALDRKRIVEEVLFGLSSPTVLPWAPGAPAHDGSALGRYPFDLNRGNALLAKAGVQGGRAELLASSQTPERVAFAQILKADLVKIGFDLDLKVVDQTEFNRRLVGGDFGIILGAASNAGKYPTQLPTGGSIYRVANNPVWGNDVPKAYAEAMMEAGTSLDPARQKAAFRRINEEILDEAWAQSIAYWQYVYLLARYVRDFSTSVDAYPVLENLSLEK